MQEYTDMHIWLLDIVYLFIEKQPHPASSVPGPAELGTRHQGSVYTPVLPCCNTFLTHLDYSPNNLRILSAWA